MEFKSWPKTPRLFRDITITEKIDGTNVAVIVNRVTPQEAELSTGHITRDDEGQHWEVGAQSRNRIIYPGKVTDNSGFAGWVYDHAYELRTLLGEGHHYGEWWGKGINRNYGMDHKRFSLFNVARYGALVGNLEVHEMGLDVVPVMYQGPFSQEAIDRAVIGLRNGGSWAAPWFTNPEGIIVFHSASRQVYKVLLENDAIPKSFVSPVPVLTAVA